MKRRNFMKSILVGGTLLGGNLGVKFPSSKSNPNVVYNILFKGGYVIDPLNNIDKIMDVATTMDGGNNVSSGVYFAKLLSGNHIATKRLLLVK